MSRCFVLKGLNARNSLIFDRESLDMATVTTLISYCRKKSDCNWCSLIKAKVEQERANLNNPLIQCNNIRRLFRGDISAENEIRRKRNERAYSMNEPVRPFIFVPFLVGDFPWDQSTRRKLWCDYTSACKNQLHLFLGGGKATLSLDCPTRRKRSRALERRAARVRIRILLTYFSRLLRARARGSSHKRER